MEENKITETIIGCAIEVHRTLGPGLFESAYQKCLLYELRSNGLFVEVEKPIPLVYKDICVEAGYRLDLLVENKIVLELKSVTELNDLHLSQILTYLKLGDYKLGYLINFNVRLLRDGVKRVIN